MKKLKKFTVNPDSYLATDIKPLMDELEALRGAEEFPTQQDFIDWYKIEGANMIGIYEYFSQFKTRTIEVMPEVGKEYEGKSTFNGEWFKGKLIGFNIEHSVCDTIRPIATPTRDEVIKRAKELGLTEAELEVLCNTK
jgi:hypothetical protein